MISSGTNCAPRVADGSGEANNECDAFGRMTVGNSVIGRSVSIAIPSVKMGIVVSTGAGTSAAYGCAGTYSGADVKYCVTGASTGGKRSVSSAPSGGLPGKGSNATGGSAGGSLGNSSTGGSDDSDDSTGWADSTGGM